MWCESDWCVQNSIQLTCTLWVGINWTMFADVANTGPDGEASCWCCCWWCNEDNCDCCAWCVELSSVLLCADADSPPNGSRLELPFSSTMLLSIATQLPTHTRTLIFAPIWLVSYTTMLFSPFFFTLNVFTVFFLSSISFQCFFLLSHTHFVSFRLTLIFIDSISEIKIKNNKSN